MVHRTHDIRSRWAGLETDSSTSYKERLCPEHRTVEAVLRGIQAWLPVCASMGKEEASTSCPLARD